MAYMIQFRSGFIIFTWSELVLRVNYCAKFLSNRFNSILTTLEALSRHCLHFSSETIWALSTFSNQVSTKRTILKIIYSGYIECKANTRQRNLVHFQNMDKSLNHLIYVTRTICI